MVATMGGDRDGLPPYGVSAHHDNSPCPGTAAR